MQIKQILAEAAVGSEITVKGWVRTKRESKNVTFININDGSVIHNIQAVAEAGVLNEETQKLITTGACVAITGTLIESQGSGQKVELQVKSALVYCTADPEKYPLQPKKHSLEFLRVAMIQYSPPGHCLVPLPTSPAVA